MEHDGPSGLPDNLTHALEAIRGGATADSQESLTLEFKEDPAHRHGVEKTRAGFLEKLVDEAICMANSEAAMGDIVVGVADKTPGPEALTGTELSEDDIAKSIFNRTVPNLFVQVRAVDAWGARLLVIQVPEARALYTRRDGAAKRRVADTQFSCRPLTEEQRRSIDAARRNPDYSNESADIGVEDLNLQVIAEVRRRLRKARELSGGDQAVPTTTSGLLRELGLTREDGSLKRAGQILLGEREQIFPVVRYQWRDFPGQDPKTTEIYDPVILALPRVLQLIAVNGEQEIARVLFDDGREAAIPSFPAQAVDEVITNAFIHRDWRIQRPIEVEQTRGILKVTSPGPLPPGVTVDNLLTTSSIPRNNALMAAMRILHLAEENSRGFDRMWSAMILSGRDAPEVEASTENVRVIVAAQQPTVAFVKGLDRLGQRFGDELVSSVSALIVLWHLYDAPLITERTVKVKTQTSLLEVRELMAALVAIGILQPVRDAAEWTLSDESRQLLGLSEPGHLAVINVQEWIQAKLADGEALQSAEIAEHAGISVGEASGILRHLRSLGRAKIDPTGPPRGRGTRWVKA